MATFIPGMTDVFPGSSEYNPDWNRIERMLAMRQKMYDDGARRVKTLYDSVFNSPMIRESDIKRRDAYLKTITESLNRVSAMDLSVPANQSLASSLMLPVTEDQNIVHDIGYTKKTRDELSRVDGLRTSSKAEDREQYWDVGAKDLQYQIEDYQNAGDKEALSMNAPTYTPKVNIQKIAEDRFKKAGISVKQDIVDGRYIWTKKNGDAVYPIAEAYVNALMQEDPAIKQMSLIKARVARRDFAKAKSMSDNISPEDAEILYITDVVKTAGTNLIKQNIAAKQQVATLERKMESWDDIIKTKGIIPGSQEHKDFLADADALQVLKQSLQDNNDVGESLTTINFNSLNEAREAADALVAADDLTKKASEVGRFLSTKNMETTVKQEPYELAKFRSVLNYEVQSSLENLRQFNRVDLLIRRHAAQVDMLNKEIAAGKYARRSGNKPVAGKNEEIGPNGEIISVTPSSGNSSKPGTVKTPAAPGAAGVNTSKIKTRQ